MPDPESYVDIRESKRDIRMGREGDLFESADTEEAQNKGTRHRASVRLSLIQC